MSTTAYEPPIQSTRGQLIDAVTILLLLFGTLFLTTYVVQDIESGDSASDVNTLADLDVNETERAQFGKLIEAETIDLEGAAAVVDANRASDDKYDISIGALLLTVLVLGGYLAFVYQRSLAEYREVIEERFGPRAESGPA